MNLIGRTPELEKVTAILKHWKRDSPLWMHIQGEPGIGKTHLIEAFRKGVLRNFHLVYRFNFRLDSLVASAQIHSILHQLHNRFPEDVKVFLGNYPGYLRKAIRSLFQSRTLDEQSRRYPHHFFSELFVQLLRFLSANGEILFVLENVDFEDDRHTAILFELLEADPALAVLILTSGSAYPPHSSGTANCHLFELKKLSALDIQKFIQHHLNTSEENARFIANHLQIKSQGNPRKIKFLLEAYYRAILPSDDSELIDPQKLHKLRVSPIPEVIFQNLLSRLSEIEVAALGFLGRLVDPLQSNVLHDILERSGETRNLLDEWLENDYLDREDFDGQAYLAIGWVEWKQFLRKAIPIRAIADMLKFLNTGSPSAVQSFQSQYPLQLSHLYFETGDKKTALRLAHDEARSLMKMGFEQRAYERYNFLKRNLGGFSEDKESQETILKEIGLLQKSMGLQENAFESFRELRDRFGKTNRHIWFYASLQMAEILLQMDAFAEARYLLNDLKIKKAADAFTKSFSYMLLGDLDLNIGNSDYALAKYQKALDFIDEVEDADFVYQLYSKIRTILVSKNSEADIRSLMERVHGSSVKDTRYDFLLQFDRLRWFIDNRNFTSAIHLAITVFREVKHHFDPAIMRRAVLYLVNIYALLSKWYLARSHLQRMLEISLFSTHPRIEALILIHLAVIEKEIAHYGKALKLLSKAEEICRREGDQPRLNEIKIHRGHIHLLVHGYVRQREYLTDALRWSIAHQDQDLFVMASLYLSSYEIQQRRLKEARHHLREARSQIKMSGSDIDKLNYIYYLLRYLSATKRLRRVESVLRVWENMSRGIAKFENLVVWFKAKLYFERGDYREALETYLVGLQRSRRYKLPHLEFHILKEVVALCHRAGLPKECDRFIPELKAAYQKLHQAIGDEILRQQFHESREVNEVIQMGIDLT